MRIVSWFSPTNRIGGMYLTDLDTLEFVKYLWTREFNDAILTHVLEVNHQDAQRWTAEGRPGYFRKEIALKKGA